MDRGIILCKMDRWKFFILFTSLVTIQLSCGCTMEGVISFPIPQTAEVIDIQRGVFFRRSTSNIIGISNVAFNDALRAGPYFDVNLSEDGEFTISTNDAFPEYEEYEVASTVGITVRLRCSGNTEETLVVSVNVIDTNNNAPEFLPTNVYDVTLAPPLPPGFQITGCLADITARDIDLTTSRINFAFTEENELFEIEYDEVNTVAQSKEFKAVLRTKSFIRSLPEVIELTISATDVDATGDPPLTTYATIRIQGDAEFELPEEPVFSEPFYLAEYTTENTIILQETISLQQGYHENVDFSLEGVFASNFVLSTTENENELTIAVTSPLSADSLREGRIILVVKAEREYTSGATTTVIVELPEVPGLKFEETNYESNIIDNTLVPLQLNLNQGYEDGYTISIYGEYAPYFTATGQSNIITLTMSPLDSIIIEENNFINLVITASSPYSTTSTIVTLGIIKDDTITPAFEKATYTGSYDTEIGLTHEDIALVQGYDESVTYALEGVHSSYFEVSNTGPVVTLTSSELPPTILAEQRILLTILVSKPRTVGANTAVYIELPPARLLNFEFQTYSGTLQEDQLTLEPILLSVGYDDDINFHLTGEHANNFQATNDGNQIEIVLSTPLPENVILENNYLILTLNAVGEHAVSTFSTIVLEILKEDTSTPVFEESIYSARYEGGYDIDVETIRLLQGYDSSVSFRIDGEYSNYFTIDVNQNNVELLLQSEIPDDIIYYEKVLLLKVLAEKPFTVGANAVIVIQLPSDINTLGFERTSYIGSIVNEDLTLESIVLNEGYTDQVSFTLNGDLSSYFSVNNEGPTVEINLQTPIPADVLDTNGVIVFELQASAPQTVSAYVTVVIEVVREITTIEQLVFGESYYTGRYTQTGDFIFDSVISLDQGFDESVEFILQGESAQWFDINVNGNSVSLILTSPIPEAVINNNQQLIFVITAQKSGTDSRSATVVISLENDINSELVLSFERTSYIGTLFNEDLTLESIVLSEGYTDQISFTLNGDLSSYFSVNNEGSTVEIILQTPIPADVLDTNGVIVFELQASAPQTVSAYATVVIEVVREITTIEQLVFGESYYTGRYTQTGDFIFDSVISLDQGFDESVEFILQGESAQWFDINVNGNSVSLILSSPIPEAVIINNQQLIFVITAQKSGTDSRSATIVISLENDINSELVLGFERTSYIGTLFNEDLTLESIVLSEGYTDQISFTLNGDLSSYFSVNNEGPTVEINLQTPIPADVLDTNGVIVFELQASAPQTVSAYATVVIEVVREITTIEQLVFGESYYTGRYTQTGDFIFNSVISLDQGFDESVEFIIQGESAQWFDINVNGNSVSLILSSPIPEAVIINNQQLIFVITAQKSGTDSINATIVISIEKDINTDLVLAFEKVSYIGSIDGEVLYLEPIVLSQGFTDQVSFTLNGDLTNYFTLNSEGSIVNIMLQISIPENYLPSNGIIILELQASAPQTLSAYTTIVIEIVQQVTSVTQLHFSEAYYTGKYIDEYLNFENEITLIQGYEDNVSFRLEGESSIYFSLHVNMNTVAIVLNSPIPENVLESNNKLVFVIVAEIFDIASTKATIIITWGDEPSLAVTFDKVFYEGQVQDSVVRHESITLNGHNDSEVTILGRYAEFFTALNAEGTVVVEASGTLPFPEELHFVALELRVDDAGAVLLLTVIHSENMEPPVVSFSSPSYELQADSSHMGILGQVSATADNGELLTYSLLLDDAHLLERLSISSEGELRLSAPANIGEYNFQAAATTQFTRATGVAQVTLKIENIPPDEENNYTLAPLQVIEIQEEQAYTNLIVQEFAGCRYTMTNRWPLDQTWVYVDETGLHTQAIDREHESIAFMALSQVQVELNLECDIDESLTRQKRSTDILGSYDYGNNKWLLADTIPYNPRRTMINIIVHDINDNAPIFEGKQDEPIVVGYPIPELEERVLPRALIELKATDADIDLNAALRYWSSEEVLAVSPSTGLVHVRNNALLVNNSILTVYATDRNGDVDGLTGSLDILVKLLDVNQIAVLTVNNAFLDKENSIVADLSTALEYEVKVLRSTIISDNEEASEGNSRKKRDAMNTDGAIMLVYVYGLIEQEPVDVVRLTRDINNAAIATVNIVSTISLEDHLNAVEICNTTGLLAATIVLAVLLFILIVTVAIWFFLRWRQNRNYDRFSDTNSIESRDMKIEQPIPQRANKPRLNIEDLRRSEKRLQEMLDAPVIEDTPKPTISKEPPIESIINISMPDPQVPIVIQSIDKLKSAHDESDDEDEYGEKSKSKRKSVVTFNENVEKIIHVENNADDDDSLPDYGIYKL